MLSRSGCSRLCVQQSIKFDNGIPSDNIHSSQDIRIFGSGKICTNTRTMHYHHLLTYPDIMKRQCSNVNPAEYIPHEYEGKPHDCEAESLTFSKLRHDLESTPLLEKEVTYFVYGSCYRDHDGYYAGFAVVQNLSDNSFVTVMAKKLPQPCSVQKVKLKTLTEACKLAERKRADIYRLCIHSWSNSPFWCIVEIARIQENRRIAHSAYDGNH